MHIRSFSNNSKVVSISMACMTSVPHELDEKVEGDRTDWFSTNKNGQDPIWACHCEVFDFELYYVFEDERGTDHSKAKAKDTRNWKLKALFLSGVGKRYVLALNEDNAYRMCRLVHRLPTPCTIDEAASILGLHKTNVTNPLQAIGA